MHRNVLIESAPFFSIIHHSPGRLRVKIDRRIADAGIKMTPGDIESLQKQIEGIKQVKINKIMGTATILYDPQKLPPEVWTALLAGEPNGPFADLANHQFTKENS